jgi:hypothetical protein
MRAFRGHTPRLQPQSRAGHGLRTPLSVVAWWVPCVSKGQNFNQERDPPSATSPRALNPKVPWQLFTLT